LAFGEVPAQGVSAGHAVVAVIAKQPLTMPQVTTELPEQVVPAPPLHTLGVAGH
jgi:hypothetical protein